LEDLPESPEIDGKVKKDLLADSDESDGDDLAADPDSLFFSSLF